MNSVDLVYFESVYRTGSVKYAAKELGVSIATVSRAISALENELGYQLFQKDGSRFHVAKNATDLYNRVLAPVAELNMLSRDISPKSSFKIVAPPFLAYKTFAQVSSKFEAEFGQQLIIEYGHSLTSREQAYADLRLGFLDLFIDFKPADSYLLKSTPIFNDKLCFFCSKEQQAKPSDMLQARYAKLKWLKSEPSLYSEFVSISMPEQALFMLDSYNDYLDVVEMDKNILGLNVSSAIDKSRFDIKDVGIDADIKLYSIMNKGLILSSGNQRAWLFKEFNSISEWIFCK